MFFGLPCTLPFLTYRSWGYAYPAAFMDGTTNGLGFTHVVVAPVPILQIINTVIGGLGTVNEFSKFANRFFVSHRMRWLQNIPFRCVVYVIALAPAFMQFQTSQAVPYLIIGTLLYLWGFWEGERLDDNGLGRVPIQRIIRPSNA
jgi:hypothetical protein